MREWAFTVAWPFSEDTGMACGVAGAVMVESS